MLRWAQFAPKLRRQPMVIIASVSLSLVLSAPPASGAPALKAAAVPRQQMINSSDRLVLDRINTLRKGFGLQVALPTTAYNALVSKAASAKRDPSLPGFKGNAVEEFALWGIAPYAPPPSARPSTAILNAWVYHDGWLGAATSNLDCTAAGAPGCNGHRRAILSPSPGARAMLYVDVAVTKVNYDGGPGTSVAVLMIWMR